MILFGALFLCIACIAAAPGEQFETAQHVLNSPHSVSHKGNPRRLQGRFLHITDVHPDPFYKTGSDPSGEHPCHAGDGNAGYFGAETTDCDAPFTLVNATFQWIKDNVKDSIDFVIWTGDSARHDNDEHYPRSNRGVEELNEFIVNKFVETFGKPDNRDDPDPTNDFVIPIVPTYGNNDILPHNIFEAGPNRWTSKYLDIWAAFIPQEQRHSFARGGWFFSEVIPNKLAVFSLNTLYFFDSNSAVDGCDADTEPGYEHFEWLRIQLQFLRERKMKAILIGHVPPARTESKQNWDETCYQKWTLWQRQYRDVIVANIFGHMNIDHFMFQDQKDLTYKFKIDGIEEMGGSDLDFSDADSDIHVAAKADYLNDLRERWADLPRPPNGFSFKHLESELAEVTKKKKKGGKRQLNKFLKAIGGPWAERYSLSVVSPSVVPNFYPTLRIIEYNISGLEKDHPAIGLPTGNMAGPTVYSTNTDDGNDLYTAFDQSQFIENSDSSEDEMLEILKKRKKDKKKKKPKPDFPVPEPPSKTALPGPAYSPQTFTFLNWTQLYANLTKINAAVAKDLQLIGKDDGQEDMDVLNFKKFTKHFNFEIEYNTCNDTIYDLRDLTVLSWLELAEKIGRAKYGKTDASREIMGSDSEEDDVEDMSIEAELAVDISSNEDGSRLTPSVLRDGSIEIEKKKKHKKGKGASMKNNRLWRTFIKRVFVSSKSEEELEQDFG